MAERKPKPPRFLGAELLPIDSVGGLFEAKIRGCVIQAWQACGAWRAECTLPHGEPIITQANAATAGTALRQLGTLLRARSRALSRLLGEG